MHCTGLPGWLAAGCWQAGWPTGSVIINARCGMNDRQLNQWVTHGLFAVFSARFTIHQLPNHSQQTFHGYHHGKTMTHSVPVTIYVAEHSGTYQVTTTEICVQRLERTEEKHIGK